MKTTFFFDPATFACWPLATGLTKHAAMTANSGNNCLNFMRETPSQTERRAGSALATNTEAQSAVRLTITVEISVVKPRQSSRSPQALSALGYERIINSRNTPPQLTNPPRSHPDKTPAGAPLAETDASRPPPR